MKLIILLYIFQIVYGALEPKENPNGEFMIKRNASGLQNSKGNNLRKRSKSTTLRHKKKIYDPIIDSSSEEDSQEKKIESNFSSSGNNFSNSNSLTSSPRHNLEKKEKIEGGSDHECKFVGIICCIWLIMLIAK